MKSVIAEANTIAKAIEVGWQKAGCPNEFTIKVFQEPQRNLFGITKTSAKVGIFFDDHAISQKIKPLLNNSGTELQKPIIATPNNRPNPEPKPQRAREPRPNQPNNRPSTPKKQPQPQPNKPVAPQAEAPKVVEQVVTSQQEAVLPQANNLPANPTVNAGVAIGAPDAQNRPPRKRRRRFRRPTKPKLPDEQAATQPAEAKPTNEPPSGQNNS